MNLSAVGAGRNPPYEINVVIEIPLGGEPVKYELDKETGAMFVDRFLNTSMYYPCNYGYIPHTLSLDGDPIDVMVATPMKLISGSVIRCRPIGLLAMTDEAGDDSKILVAPLDSVSKFHHNVHSPQDIQPAFLNMITHFFEHYKDLEEEKWVKVDAWYGKEQAIETIKAAMNAYQDESNRLKSSLAV